MTKIWGPLGWATLHSIAALYPDTPTELEKQLLLRWIDAFRRTIVCEKCHNHFTQLLKDYSTLYPGWNTSRKNISLFILRAHNTVNKRNGTPVLSMKEAFEHLRRKVDPSTSNLQRQSYILYIRRDWSKQTTLAGASSARFVKELTTVETEYWGTRDVFTWNEIEELINGNHIDPLPSADIPRSSLGRLAQSVTGIPRPPRSSFRVHAPSPVSRVPTPAPVVVSQPTPTISKPRFSFVSR
jgi:hypothetical protein